MHSYLYYLLPYCWENLFKLLRFLYHLNWIRSWLIRTTGNNIKVYEIRLVELYNTWELLKESKTEEELDLNANFFLYFYYFFRFLINLEISENLSSNLTIKHKKLKQKTTIGFIFFLYLNPSHQ